MSSTGRRVGRDALLGAALDLLGETMLTDAAGAIGTRSVAERAKVAPSTVSHHFAPLGGRGAPNRRLARAALERAIAIGNEVTNATRVELQDGAVVVTATGSSGVDIVVQAAVANLNRWRQPTHTLALTARYLLYAAAARDDDARELLADREAEIRRRLIPAYDAFVEALDRTWAPAWDSSRFAVAVSSMADGFAMRNRFDPELADPEVFGEAVSVLVEGCTVGRATYVTEPAPHVPLPSSSKLDPHKRDAIAAAAARLYDHDGWPALTIASVAAEARVSRATVNAHFRTRLGLAAPVFGRCIPMLDAAIWTEKSLPLHLAIRNHLERLAAYAQQHPAVTAAFLASLHEREYAQHERNPSPNPVFVVPIHELLVGLIEPATNRFRAGLVDSPIKLLQFSIFLTRSTLSLATGRPDATPGEVADLIHDTVVAGALARRPAVRGTA
ncbi:MAG TPA: TetR/AcrR family transcriptional regulator [Acidimicrobiales bacterium]|jgi:AcrR family transcriptional regulator|nr:TetR/AcrR family transcriptional regulator [Acidimicrobiales bacterium]